MKCPLLLVQIIEVPVISIPIYDELYPRGWASGRECSDSLFVEPVFTEEGIIENYDKRPILRVPGKTNSALLLPANDIKLKAGSEYRWVTKDKWRIKCYNVPGGEGFMAYSPEGLIYYFDRRSATSQPDPDDLYVYIPNMAMDNNLTPRSVGMLATRVEDQFGNSVSYQYDNLNRLTRIYSNDGRSITLGYVNSDSPRIDHIAANGRTWRYEYVGVGTLKKVILPDGRFWEFDRQGFGGRTVGPEQTSFAGINSECGSISYLYLTDNFNTSFRFTHPDGMKGDFLLKYRVHARANMTRHINIGFSRFSDCLMSLSLSKKTLHFNNADEMVWNYSYSENYGSYIGDSFNNISHLNDSDLPPDVDSLLHKAVLITNPENIKTKYYVNRHAQSAIENSIKAIQYYNKDGYRVKTTVYNIEAGTDYGNVISRNPSNPLSPEVSQRTLKETHTYYYPQGSDRYYTQGKITNI